MKILQVNNVYGEKSTGKITKENHDGLLRAGHEAVSAFGRGAARSGENVVRLCPEWYGKLNALRARVTGIPYGGCFFSTLRLQRLIRKEKPDVVHLQCINGDFVNIYRLVDWLKRKRIKTVISLHAEFTPPRLTVASAAVMPLTAISGSGAAGNVRIRKRRSKAGFSTAPAVPGKRCGTPLRVLRRTALSVPFHPGPSPGRGRAVFCKVCPSGQFITASTPRISSVRTELLPEAKCRRWSVSPPFSPGRRTIPRAVGI